MTEFIDDLADLFPDTIGVRRMVSKSPSGTKTYSPTTESIPCRITQGREVQNTMSGQETVSTIRALLRGVYGVTTDDQFTLPARFIPNKVTAVAVNSITDENGPLYEEVKF